MNRVVALTALTLCSVASQASLIVNGSFEEPNTSVWEHYSDGQVPGWRAANGGVLEIGVGAVYGVTGHAGRTLLELDSNANTTVSQDVVLNGGHVELSFLHAKRGTNLEGRSLDTCDFDVLWNGQLLDRVRPTETEMGRRSYVLATNIGVNTLAFRAAGTSDGTGAMLDDVRLEVVPEPCSLAAFGVSALFALSRRKR